MTGRVPGLIAGAENLEGIAFIDVDDTVRGVHCYAQQGAASGYTGKRGLNIRVATISTPLAAPVIGRPRLRGDRRHRLAGRQEPEQGDQQPRSTTGGSVP